MTRQEKLRKIGNALRELRFNVVRLNTFTNARSCTWFHGVAARIKHAHSRLAA